MTKGIKKLNVLAIAVLAGLLITFTSVDALANEFSNVNNETAISVLGSSVSSLMLVDNIQDDNKCGEGKCGAASKETKKEGKKEVKADKKDGKVATKEGKVSTTEEGKCGEGKCGGAEKKEGKVEKKTSKTETKEGKCGTGKCGVA